MPRHREHWTVSDETGVLDGDERAFCCREIVGPLGRTEGTDTIRAEIHGTELGLSLPF